MPNNTQVAHLWAQQTKDYARGSNFYFHGPTIFSYGSHFPVASFTGEADGRRVVLFNSRTYSPSTTRHQSYARRALPSDCLIFTVPVVVSRFVRESPGLGASEHSQNADHYRTRYADWTAKAPRARGTKWKTKEERQSELLSVADDFAAEWNLYRVVFQLDPVEFPALPRLSDDPEHAALLERVRVSVAEREAREAAERPLREAREAAARAAREAADAKGLADWREHAGPLPAVFRHSSPARVRVTRDGAGVETTTGAFVGAGEARNLASGLLALRARGALDSLSLPMTVGDFQLLAVDDSGLEIGCHRIEWSEVEYLRDRFAQSSD